MAKTKTLSSIVKKYNKQLNDYETKKASIEEQIAKLEKELEETEHSYVNWIDGILIPLAKELMKRKGLKYFEIYGPFGLSCETSVYMANERNGAAYGGRSGESKIPICEVDTWSLTVRPDMKYRTDETLDKYPRGSIGELNGWNDVYQELPDDIDEIVNLLAFSKGEKNEEK